MSNKSRNRRIYLEIQTDFDFSQPANIARFLLAWRSKVPDLCPDRWGYGEFPRTIIDFDNELRDFLRAWQTSELPISVGKTKPRSTLVFFRVQNLGPPPRAEVGKPLCLYRVSMDFQNKTSINDIEFLIEQIMINLFSPLFLGITSEYDLIDRHVCRFIDEFGGYTQFTGVAVARKIPGLYWRTYLSDKLMENEQFQNLKEITEIGIPQFECNFENGYWKLQSSVSLSDFCERDWLPAQEYIESQIGKPLFFNRHLVGIPRRPGDAF